MGSGGQVLVSEAAAVLVRDGLPPGAALADLGAHRLKDLGRPERIFQLHAPGLQAGFPALRSLGNPALPNNLLAQLSSFVGRAGGGRGPDPGAVVSAGHLGGKVIYRVPSLSLPGPEDSDPAPGSSDAVALFADRARAHGVALAAEEQAGPLVVSVCQPRARG